MPSVSFTSAFNGYIRNYTFTPDEVTLDAQMFLEDCRQDLRQLINDVVSVIIYIVVAK